MRAILATVKPVLLTALDFCGAAIGVLVAIAIAHAVPVDKPVRVTVVQKQPSTVPDVPPPIIDFSWIEDEQRATVVASLAPVDAPIPIIIEKPVPEKPYDAVAEAKAYLAKTAFPGGTMTMLGREKSIECFDPRFAVNLAAAVADGREHGFANVGVLSGCRPPKLGIGGFADKRNSLHSVGLAADMHGIGSPCSAQTKHWHKIAAAHGIYPAYSPCNGAEWNHMQGTKIRMTTPALRATITKRGDIAPDLNVLWSVTQKVALAAMTPITILADIVTPEPVRRAAKYHKRKHYAKRVKHRHYARRHHRRHYARA